MKQSDPQARMERAEQLGDWTDRQFVIACTELRIDAMTAIAAPLAAIAVRLTEEKTP